MNITQTPMQGCSSVAKINENTYIITGFTSDSTTGTYVPFVNKYNPNDDTTLTIWGGDHSRDFVNRSNTNIPSTVLPISVTANNNGQVLILFGDCYENSNEYAACFPIFNNGEHPLFIGSIENDQIVIYDSIEIDTTESYGYALLSVTTTESGTFIINCMDYSDIYHNFEVNYDDLINSDSDIGIVAPVNHSSSSSSFGLGDSRQYGHTKVYDRLPPIPQIVEADNEYYYYEYSGVISSGTTVHPINTYEFIVHNTFTTDNGIKNDFVYLTVEGSTYNPTLRKRDVLQLQFDNDEYTRSTVLGNEVLYYQNHDHTDTTHGYISLGKISGNDSKKKLIHDSNLANINPSLDGIDCTVPSMSTASTVIYGLDKFNIYKIDTGYICLFEVRNYNPTATTYSEKEGKTTCWILGYSQDLTSWEYKIITKECSTSTDWYISPVKNGFLLQEDDYNPEIKYYKDFYSESQEVTIISEDTRRGIYGYKYEPALDQFVNEDGYYLELKIFKFYEDTLEFVEIFSSEFPEAPALSTGESEEIMFKCGYNYHIDSYFTLSLIDVANNTIHGRYEPKKSVFSNNLTDFNSFAFNEHFLLHVFYSDDGYINFDLNTINVANVTQKGTTVSSTLVSKLDAKIGSVYNKLSSDIAKNTTPSVETLRIEDGKVYISTDTAASVAYITEDTEFRFYYNGNKYQEFTLFLINASDFKITFDADIHYTNDIEPIFSKNLDILKFFSLDGGETWYCAHLGANYYAPIVN